MLIFSYPFVGKPQTKLASVDHAHNYPLHILAEQGYAGFLLLVGASLLLVVAAFSTLRFLKNAVPIFKTAASGVGFTTCHRRKTFRTANGCQPNFRYDDDVRDYGGCARSLRTYCQQLRNGNI